MTATDAVYRPGGHRNPAEFCRTWASPVRWPTCVRTCWTRSCGRCWRACLGSCVWWCAGGVGVREPAGAECCGLCTWGGLGVRAHAAHGRLGAVAVGMQGRRRSWVRRAQKHIQRIQMQGQGKMEGQQCRGSRSRGRGRGGSRGSRGLRGSRGSRCKCRAVGRGRGSVMKRLPERVGGNATVKAVERAIESFRGSNRGSHIDSYRERGNQSGSYRGGQRYSQRECQRDCQRDRVL